MEKLDLEFYVASDFKTGTYAVCDKNNVLAYEKLFHVIPGTLPQSPRIIPLQLDEFGGIKAIQIAKTIKDYLNVKELNLILKTGWQLLTLTDYANKIGINLKFCWIEEGETNLADEYLRLKGGNQYENKPAENFLNQYYDNNFDIKKYCQENKLNNSVNQQENANDNKDVTVIDNIDND